MNPEKFDTEPGAKLDREDKPWTQQEQQERQQQQQQQEQQQQQ